MFNDFIICAKPKTISADTLHYEWEILNKDITRLETIQVETYQNMIEIINSRIKNIEMEIRNESNPSNNNSNNTSISHLQQESGSNK